MLLHRKIHQFHYLVQNKNLKMTLKEVLPTGYNIFEFFYRFLHSNFNNVYTNFNTKRTLAIFKVIYRIQGIP